MDFFGEKFLNDEEMDECKQMLLSQNDDTLENLLKENSPVQQLDEDYQKVSKILCMSIVSSIFITFLSNCRITNKSEEYWMEYKDIIGRLKKTLDSKDSFFKSDIEYIERIMDIPGKQVEICMESMKNKQNEKTESIQTIELLKSKIRDCEEKLNNSYNKKKNYKKMLQDLIDRSNESVSFYEQKVDQLNTEMDEEKKRVERKLKEKRTYIYLKKVYEAEKEVHEYIIKFVKKWKMSYTKAYEQAMRDSLNYRRKNPNYYIKVNRYAQNMEPEKFKKESIQFSDRLFDEHCRINILHKLLDGESSLYNIVKNDRRNSNPERLLRLLKFFHNSRYHIELLKSKHREDFEYYRSEWSKELNAFLLNQKDTLPDCFKATSSSSYDDALMFLPDIPLVEEIQSITPIFNYVYFQHAKYPIHELKTNEPLFFDTLPVESALEQRKIINITIVNCNQETNKLATSKDDKIFRRLHENWRDKLSRRTLSLKKTTNLVVTKRVYSDVNFNEVSEYENHEDEEQDLSEFDATNLTLEEKINMNLKMQRYIIQNQFKHSKKLRKLNQNQIQIINNMKLQATSTTTIINEKPKKTQGRKKKKEVESIEEIDDIIAKKENSTIKATELYKFNSHQKGSVIRKNKKY